MNPTPNLDTLLRRLPWSPWSVILCGSAPLAFRGVRDVGDLDVLLDEATWADLRIQDLRTEYGRRIYRIPGIDAFDRLPRLGYTFDQVIDRADHYYVDGTKWHVLPIRDMIAIKALAPAADKHVTDMRAALDFL